MKEKNKEIWSFRFDHATLQKLDFLKKYYGSRSADDRLEITDKDIVLEAIDYLYMVKMDQAAGDTFLDRIQACYELGTKQQFDLITESLNHLLYLMQKGLEYHNLNLLTIKAPDDEESLRTMVNSMNKFERAVDEKLMDVVEYVEEEE